MDGKFLGKIVSAEVGWPADIAYRGEPAVLFEFKFDGAGAAWRIPMTALKLTLEDAKKHTVSQLKNVPIEVTVEDGAVRSFRILHEVI